jgi:hypothetical protein
VFTIIFWKAATERAIKTGAQFVLVTIGFGLVVGTGDSETSQTLNAFTLNYATIGGVFLGGALVSYLTSLVSDAVTGGTGPSLTSAEKLEPKHAAE